MDDATTPVENVRVRLASLDPKVVAAIALCAVCVGVWIGFKVAGGSVSDLAEPTAPCHDCDEADAEAAILRQDVPE